MKKAPKVLKWYQYISKLTPPSCRYYPTCSEYAKWLYENSNFISATAKSALRVLRCNQLFIGGVDYPRVSYKNPSLLSLKNLYYKRVNIEYWFIFNGKDYYILKDFRAMSID